MDDFRRIFLSYEQDVSRRYYTDVRRGGALQRIAESDVEFSLPDKFG